MKAIDRSIVAVADRSLRHGLTSGGFAPEARRLYQTHMGGRVGDHAGFLGSRPSSSRNFIPEPGT